MKANFSGWNSTICMIVCEGSTGGGGTCCCCSVDGESACGEDSVVGVVGVVEYDDGEGGGE